MFPGKPLVVRCLLMAILGQGAYSANAQEVIPGTQASPSPSPTVDPKDDQNKSPHEKAFERLEWRRI